MTIQDHILTIPEIAALLRVADKTVYGLVQKSDLPGFKVGGQWRFSRSAIDSWIDMKTRAAGAQLANNGAEPTGSTREK